MKVKISPKQAVILFNIVYDENREGNGKDAFYCGITNDIKRREKEHNASFLKYVECENKDDAVELERLLGEDGFDIGRNYGNGAKDDSVYTYIYKKTEYTIQKMN